ncbi:MAG: protein translocase subunit SecD [Candidatus Dormibacteraceae bacterium]
MQRVLSWWIRFPVILILLFAILTDGAGYWHRIINHYPLTGSVPGLPPSFNGWPLFVHKGLDLSGGSRLVLQMNGLQPGQDAATVQQQTINVIEHRINALGVNEPVVQASGKDRIEVELAGVPASKAAEVIGQTARLITTTWVKDPSVTIEPVAGEAGYRPQISPLKSDMVTGANASLDPNGGTGWVVNVTLSSAGSAVFGKLSTDAYNACPQTTCPERQIAEWLNLTQDDVNHWSDRGPQLAQPTYQGGKFILNPEIENPITTGQMVIQGRFTADQAKDLANTLNEGSLPVNLAVLSSTDVDPSLGNDSIQRSLYAGLLGLLVVILFMIALYRLPGLLASIALLFYAGVLLMLFKVFAFTVTLAGLAGFVLSVGMAVDANVLIFERLKEELRRGRGVGAAVEVAMSRAWPAVRDSNTSTLITSLVLYLVGSGSVKGFALTLIVGVLVSLLSSIIVTHNLLALIYRSAWIRGQSWLGLARVAER